MSLLRISIGAALRPQTRGVALGLVSVLGVAAVFGLVPASAQAATPGITGGITAFETAWERVRTGQPDQPDPEALRDLAIYPYLVAARLARDLRGDDAAAVDGQVQAFLNAHAGEPVTWRLQRNWMRSLARREDWAGLLAHYDPARDTSKLQCQRLHARIATDATQGLVAVITKAYLTGRTRPACKTAFEWLKAQGALPVQTIERRAHLALEAGNASLARYLAKRLPAGAATPIQRWAALIAKPEPALREAIAQPRRTVSREALEAGFSRLVRTNVDDAKEIYPQLLKARHLQGKAAQPFTRLLALGLAWDRRSDALPYFERLGALHDDLKAAVWRIRSALWNGDWKHARRWITALTAEQANTPQWRYWRARADESLGRKDAARAVYQSLMQGHGYYALLAGWRLGVGYAPNTASLVDQPELQKALISDTGVRRAHELFMAGLPSRAGLEWRVALGRATPAQRLQAVHLAHAWGWYSQSIATAARQGVFHAYDLLYPLPYPKAVAAAATAAELPEDWVYGVIRQESLYNPRAVSPSGALGLMQLMPATAELVARRNDLPKPAGQDDLFDPSVNLELGTKYLRTLLDRENGAFIVALAGYNAGASRAEHWLPSQPLAADVWIENIPYTETRHYIQRILWHVAIFGWERSGKPQNISALLAPVEPAG